jgi:hypothetical protein
LPLQQPCGQEPALQTHCPVLVLHCWPDAHAMQVAPPIPHMELVSLESGSHADPLQHPAHDVPPHEHMPAEQACPDAHALHVTPAVPQSDVDWAE